MHDQNITEDTIGLFSKSPDLLEENEIGILFEEYKFFVELSEKLGDRRHNSNIFFLTINTSLITIFTGFLNISNANHRSYLWSFASCFSGVILCLVWRQLILSYKQLNSGKFQVIHLLENHLPARLFFAEWNAVKQGDGSQYLQLTKVESIIPLVFIFFYLAIGASTLIFK